MRRLITAVIAAVSALAVLAIPGPASAQSFLESLFGSAPASRPRTSVQVIRVPAPLAPPAYSPYRPQVQERAAPNQGGTVRTMCVRLCDGYYWPINYSVPRHRVSRDADICASSCTSEARLFFHSSSTSEIKTAQDLTGRAYTSLPTAFAYRKRLVSGCTCRPAPWSEAERYRHHRYAVAEGLVPEGQAGGGVRVLAGGGGAAVSPPEILAGKPVPEPQRESAVAVAAVSEPEAVSVDVVATEPIPSAQGDRKPVRAKSARKDAARVASSLPLAAPSRRTKVASQSATATWPAFSQSAAAKYSWPGDPPSRYR